MGVLPARTRMEITVETDRVVTIRRSHARRVWCREGGRSVDAVSPSEAGILHGMTQPRLRDQAGAEGWHVCEDWDGELLICLDSLLRSM